MSSTLEETHSPRGSPSSSSQSPQSQSQGGLQRIYCTMGAVLDRLPFQFVRNLKLVSKEWNFMVNRVLEPYLSSAFVANTETPDHVAMIRFCNNGHTIQRFHVQGLNTLQFPITIIGSCKNRVCLGDKMHKIFLVIDVPSQECWYIPAEPSEEIGDYGFGFVNDDYRIVKVSAMVDGHGTHMEIFSFNEQRWRHIDFPNYEVSFHAPASFKSPNLFWHDRSRDSLVTFDMSLENFHEIPLPVELHDDNPISLGVVRVRRFPSDDEVQVLWCCRYQVQGWGETKTSRFWRLEQNDLLDLGTILDSEGPMKPLCFHPCPTIIALLEGNRKIKVHHCADNSQTEVPCFGGSRIDAIGF